MPGARWFKGGPLAKAYRAPFAPRAPHDGSGGGCWKLPVAFLAGPQAGSAPCPRCLRARALESPARPRRPA
eukprot:4442945-Pyramimonas_sp.AAC.1